MERKIIVSKKEVNYFREKKVKFLLKFLDPNNQQLLYINLKKSTALPTDLRQPYLGLSPISEIPYIELYCTV